MNFIPLIAAGVSAIGQKQAGEAGEEQAQQQSILDKAEGASAEQVSLTQEASQRRSSREFQGDKPLPLQKRALPRERHRAS